MHLHGSFNMSRACAAHFREQNSGAFVHMTSTSGLVGNFGQANYMAAKLGIMGLSRGIALDMARFKVRSNCIAPFAWTRMINSIPAQTEEEKRRVERFQQMTPEKIAPLVVYLGSDRAEGISGQVFSVRNNEIFLFNQPRPIRSHPSLRRLDAGKDRCAAQGCVRPLVHAARTLWRCVFVGSGVMARIRHVVPAGDEDGLIQLINEKLLALKIPEVVQTYTEKDAILYALGVGLGHDPLNADELPFVYEKSFKVLPTFAVVLAWPGFWARDLDTGIDWVEARGRRARAGAASPACAARDRDRKNPGHRDRSTRAPARARSSIPSAA